MSDSVPERSRRKAVFGVSLAALAVAVLWSAVAYYRSYERHERRVVAEQLASVADLKVAVLDRWRKERLGDATVFAENPAFARLVRALLAGDAGAATETGAWLDRCRQAYAYDSILLLDTSYRVRATSPAGAEGAAARISPESGPALREGRAVFEDFYRDDADGRIWLEVLAPVRDADGGPLLAVVVLRIDPVNALYPFVSRWPTPSKTAETLLVRREGADALYLSDPRFRPGGALRLRMPLSRTDVPTVQAVLGATGAVEGVDYRGEPVIAAIRAVEGSPWFVVARIDVSEALAAVRERGRIAWAFALTFFVAGGSVLALAFRARRAREQRELLRAAEELRESRERLQAITDAARDAILMMDEAGRVTFWNPAAERILGWTAGEMVGRDLHGRIAPSRYHGAFAAAFPRFVATGEGGAVGRTLELSALHRDGREVPVALSLSAVRIDGAWNAVGVLRDVSDEQTARRELTRALEEKDEANERLEATSALAMQMAREAETASLAKSQFLANMSHEIRTPMNGVLGMTGLLLDSSLTDEQRRFALVVKASAEALLAVINDILDFSKIEAGRLELEEIDFDLRSMIEDVVEMHALRAQDKGLELVCRIDPEMPTLLRGDPGRLRQVLVNLIGNAIKFTHSGEVVVGARVEAETDTTVTGRFEVRDTGIGIPVEKVGLLFHAFQQLDASTTRRYGGTGLGLTICKRLAHLMGGDVGVSSVEGEGSTFWFTALLGKQEQPRPGAPERADLCGVRVLAVDDNATNRLVLEEQVESWGMRYEEADGAEQALRMLRAAVDAGDPFRIVITDMQMPVTDGETLGRAVKADPVLRSTILVMMTSLGLRGDAKRLEAIGFAAYLTKPVKQSHLHDCLATVLGRSLAPAGGPPQALLTRHSLSEARRRGFRILLVEDNPTNQQVAVRVLEKLGYRAEVADDGERALLALRESPRDLVFMDVQMPVMDGFEATRAIRSGAAGERSRKVPIVAMTAHAMKGDRERCLEAGMDDYISKPIVPADLSAALERWLPGEEQGPALLPPRSEGALARKEPLPVFDREAFSARLMGDAELVDEIARAFLEDAPSRVRAVREAARKGEAAEAGRIAHALRGACANVGAAAMAATAAEVEAAAGAGRLERLAALLPDLEAAWDALEPRLSEVLR